MKTQLEMTLNPNAKDWAEYFMQLNPHCNIDEDVMHAWFANAMMAMHDHLKGYVALCGDHLAEIVEAQNDTR